MQNPNAHMNIIYELAKYYTKKGWSRIKNKPYSY